jgi:hypothetical protein
VYPHTLLLLVVVVLVVVEVDEDSLEAIQVSLVMVADQHSKTFGQTVVAVVVEVE